MKKIILALAIFVVGNAASASSNITGMINSGGELVVYIGDKVNEPPYDAALLWSALIGAEPTKQLKTVSFSLTCATSVPKPLGQRVGSCRMVVAKDKVIQANGYFGAVITNKEALLNTNEINLKLSEGKFLFTSNHTQQAVGIRIDQALVKHP